MMMVMIVRMLLARTGAVVSCMYTNDIKRLQQAILENICKLPC